MEKTKTFQRAKAKRIQYYQISFATNTKGTSLSGEETSNLKNLVHIQTAISKPHGNSKRQNYNRYTHIKEKATQAQHKNGHQTKREKNKRGDEKDHKNKPKTIKKITARRYILVITLKVNRLSPPTKRQRPAESIQKQDLYICCLHVTDPPQLQEHIQTESEETEEGIP